jgi:hypothetical protein
MLRAKPLVYGCIVAASMRIVCLISEEIARLFSQIAERCDDDGGYSIGYIREGGYI